MTYIWPKMQFEDVDWKMLSTWQFVAQRTMTIRDLSEISRGEGGGGGGTFKFGFGIEGTHPYNASEIC